MRVGGCRASPSIVAEENLAWIQVQTSPCVRRHKKHPAPPSIVQRLCSNYCERVALSTSSASSHSLVHGNTHPSQVRAVNIGGHTCPGPCHLASAATPSPHDPPPPCKRRHRLTVHGPPMGALWATLAGVVFEALGEMPETRENRTKAGHSAGCGVFFGGVSGGASESRLVAAWSASPRATMSFDHAMSRITNSCKSLYKLL